MVKLEVLKPTFLGMVSFLWLTAKVAKETNLGEVP